MSKAMKLFIVEGESREYTLLNSMINCFFKGKYESTTIYLPATQNIYMLYNKMLEDNFDTDIVEVLRENVSAAERKLKGINRQEIDEVFLIFDYDIHQNNLVNDATIGATQVLKQMLTTFDNETENGKLYISYPMIEALYDFKDMECESYTGCILPLEIISKYKSMVSDGNKNSNSQMSIIEWEKVLAVFGPRIACLFDCNQMTYEYYRENVNPTTVFKRELAIYEKGYVFVMSALPELLLDYFRKDFWNRFITLKRKRYSACRVGVIR